MMNMKDKFESNFTKQIQDLKSGLAFFLIIMFMTTVILILESKNEIIEEIRKQESNQPAALVD